MKLIFSKEGVKREIHAPFGLCIAADDLDALILALKRAQGGMKAEGSVYGWVQIDRSHPCDSKPGTRPLRWDE